MPDNNGARELDTLDAYRKPFEPETLCRPWDSNWLTLRIKLLDLAMAERRFTEATTAETFI
jgi:hypothetical protein